MAGILLSFDLDTTSRGAPDYGAVNDLLAKWSYRKAGTYTGGGSFVMPANTYYAFDPAGKTLGAKACANQVVELITGLGYKVTRISAARFESNFHIANY